MDSPSVSETSLSTEQKLQSFIEQALITFAPESNQNTIVPRSNEIQNAINSADPFNGGRLGRSAWLGIQLALNERLAAEEPANSPLGFAGLSYRQAVALAATLYCAELSRDDGGAAVSYDLTAGPMYLAESIFRQLDADPLNNRDAYNRLLDLIPEFKARVDPVPQPSRPRRFWNGLSETSRDPRVLAGVIALLALGLIGQYLLMHQRRAEAASAPSTIRLPAPPSSIPAVPPEQNLGSDAQPLRISAHSWLDNNYDDGLKTKSDTGPLGAIAVVPDQTLWIDLQLGKKFPNDPDPQDLSVAVNLPSEIEYGNEPTTLYDERYPNGTKVPSLSEAPTPVHLNSQGGDIAFRLAVHVLPADKFVCGINPRVISAYFNTGQIRVGVPVPVNVTNDCSR